MSASQTGSPPPAYAFCFSLRGFSGRKAPQNIFLRGDVRYADGRKQRLFPGRVYGFLFWFSFLSPERKENKFFLRVNQTPLTGGRGGPTQAGFLSFRLVLFLSQKEKEWKKTSG